MIGSGVVSGVDWFSKVFKAVSPFSYARSSSKGTWRNTISDLVDVIVEVGLLVLRSFMPMFVVVEREVLLKVQGVI